MMHVMMYVMYDIALTATDAVFKILTFLKATYLKCKVMAKLLNQMIIKGFQVSNYLFEPIPICIHMPPLLQYAL